MSKFHVVIILMNVFVELQLGYSKKQSCTFSTDEGRCCAIPFVFNNRTYTECTADLDKENWRRQWNIPWCPVQSVQQTRKHKCFRTENSCGGVRTASAGVISSSNFPRRIKNNSECTWNIKVPQSNRISLNFTHFNLSHDGSCISAYLNIYDGENTTYPLLNKLCGSAKPPPVVSTSNTMTLFFRSMTSEQGQGKGFRAYYDTGECEVGTWGGNGDGACCVFPFIYKGEVYNTCITKDAEKTPNMDPWCAVTSNYDRDRKRGLCIQEHVPCSSRQFECTNNHWWKQCIDINKKCNGPAECADGSDEEGCPSMNNPYKCTIIYLTKTLVWKLGRKCAYQDYCYENTTTYDSSPCNISSWNKCNNGRCIPPEWVCDGKDDCGDKSDETQPQCPYKELSDPKACSWISDCRKWEKQIGKGPLTKIQNMVTCHHSNTTVIPQYLPHTTTTIIIVAKKLHKLSPSSFARYDKLERLRLQDNQISEIRPYTFSNLYRLEDLNLNYNNLTVIKSNTFDGLHSLQKLHIQGNPLQVIEKDAFFGLSRVRTLNLTYLKLKKIESGAFRGMVSLSKLYLDGNEKLTTLPLDIFDPVGLTYLSADRFEFCCIAKLSGKNCSAPKDLFSSCEDLMANPTLGISIWILGCIALFGNGFVLIWRLKTKSESKVHSVLLLNLAISDFLMGIYLVLIGSVDVYYRGYYAIFSEQWKRSSLCQFCGFLSTLSSEASVFILTIMTTDRFVAITYPLRNISLKRCGAYKALLLIWILAFIIALIPLTGIEYFNDFYARSGVCLPLHLTADKPAGWEYSVFVFLVLNFVSFLGIFVLYLLMFVKIRQSNSMTGVTQKSPTTSIGSRMVFIVLTDFVCWIPIIIIGGASLLGMQAKPAVYAWVAVFVLPLNSALNPILYTISTTNFRRNINTTVRKNSKKLHGFSLTATENQTMITTPRKKESMVDNNDLLNGRKLAVDNNRNNGCLTPMLSDKVPYRDTQV